jgi:nucleoside-diphosphate-sugar epimerase
MTILVSGANGFVGAALCEKLRRNAVVVRGAVRTKYAQTSFPTDVVIDSLSAENDWTSALRNVKQVVHLAARVHVMSDTSADPLAEFRRVNVEGTKNLARQAANAGVRRFIFLSSVKVNGEFTADGKAFTSDDKPNPQDSYAISKCEAEFALRQISAETDMEVVIIRSPLVYGPGVKANFESMMRWLERGWPMPLGCVTQNQRSLVALDNLVDLIVTCLKHPAAAHQTFLVSDGEDLSTAALLKRMGAALGRPACLLPVPLVLLKLGALIINKLGIYQRLCGSLRLDIGHTRHLLGWKPPVSVDEGLRLAAQGVSR